MFDLLINVFEQALIVFFLYSLTHEHRKNTLVFAFLHFLFSFTLITCINQISISESLLFVLFALISFFYLKITTYLSTGNALMFAVLPISTITVINAVSDISVMFFLFPGKSFYEILTRYQIPFDLAMQLTHAVAFYFIARVLRSHEIQMPEKDWYIAFALVGLSNVMAVCFQTVYFEYASYQFYLLIGVYSVGLFIIFILVLFNSLYSHIVEESKQKLEINILQSQIESNEKVLRTREELNRIRHDMKHFILLLKKENINIQSDEINETIRQYESVDLSSVPIQTRIPAINYVLNIKREEALLKNISFICSINLTKDVQMEDSDLYLLLSNLIDNAIIHIGIKKIIRINMREVKDMTMIQIINSVDGPTVDVNGNFLNKKQNESHGYGLMTVRLLVQKYHGYFMAEQDGVDISCTIMLPRSENIILS